MARAKSLEMMVVVGTSLPVPVLELVDRMAEKEGMTRSQFVRRAVHAYLSTGTTDEVQSARAAVEGKPNCPTTAPRASSRRAQTQ